MCISDDVFRIFVKLKAEEFRRISFFKSAEGARGVPRISQAKGRNGFLIFAVYRLFFGVAYLLDKATFFV